MGYNIQKNKSTKPERIFYEILKEMHIPFKHRWKILDMEIDFVLCDKFCIEIDGHDQDGIKNEILASLGYVPLHIHNSQINRDNIRQLIKELKC